MRMEIFIHWKHVEQEDIRYEQKTKIYQTCERREANERDCEGTKKAGEDGFMQWKLKGPSKKE